MQAYEVVDRELDLWIALLESQCVPVASGLQDCKTSEQKASRFGTLRLSKARPVYLSQLIQQGKFE